MNTSGARHAGSNDPRPRGKLGERERWAICLSLAALAVVVCIGRVLRNGPESRLKTMSLRGDKPSADAESAGGPSKGSGGASGHSSPNSGGEESPVALPDHRVPAGPDGGDCPSGASSGGSTAATLANLRVANIKRLTTIGSLAGASWSPNGKYLIAAPANFEGIYLVAEDGSVHLLTDVPGSGFKPEWSADGEFVFFRCHDVGCKRANKLEFPFTEEHRHVLAPGGSAIDLGWLQKSYRFAFGRDDEVYVVKDGALLKITDGTDKYYCPFHSPSGAKIVYEGISTGIYVADLESWHSKPLGPGHNAVWSANERYVFCDVTQDDGTVYTAGDIVVVDVETGERRVLTETQDRIEQRPAVSVDGQKIAFDANGDIYVGTIEGLPVPPALEQDGDRPE